jgi:hypothetical protein
MKRTTVFLDEDLDRDVKALAERQGRPAAGLVREALAEYVARHRRGGSSLSFVGAGRSGRSDVAQRHEEILEAELKPHGGGDPA